MALISCSDKSEEPSLEEGGKRFLDIHPITFEIYASDGTNDLLDPSTEGNISQQVSVTYEGVDYYYTPASGYMKMFLATFKGLQLKTQLLCDTPDLSNAYTVYKLEFGEFDATKNYDDMTFVVNWPDGKKDTVVFDYRYKKINGKPSAWGTVRLNGTLIDGLAISRVF